MQREHITVLPLDPRGLASGVELRGRDGAGTGRVEPLARTAQGGIDVDEHGPACDAPPGPVINGVPGARRDVVGGGAVVELVRVIADVRERVPLTRPLRVVVVEPVVEERVSG